VHDFAYRAEPDLLRVHPEFELDRSYFLSMRKDDMRFKRTGKLAGRLMDDIRKSLTSA